MGKSLRTISLGLVLVLGLAFTTACQPPPVKVSNSMDIRCGFSDKSVSVDWFFPSGTPKGLLWLQHGFTESNNDWDTFGRDAAARGYLVMAPTLPTFDLFGCTVQNVGNNTPFLNNVAKVFAGIGDPDSEIGATHADAATQAGHPGQALPQNLLFSGHSAGGEAVLYVANRLRSNHAGTFAKLRGVVLQDSVKSIIGDNHTKSLDQLKPTTLPIYALASPKSSCNADQSGTRLVIEKLTNRSFHGAQVTTGVHGDIFGTSQNAIGTTTCGTPQPQNTNVTRGLTLNWFDDQLAGTTTATYYPGGAVYQALVSAGIITTLP